MSIVLQVLSANDIEEVYTYASKRLEAQISDANERMLHSWSVKWRREALEHYLKLGWSFIARENGRTTGFFLGQAFLFFRGQTQTLWVEHVEADSVATEAVLVETAVKIAREKHLQRVLFAESKVLEKTLSAYKPEWLEQTIAVVKTTKG